MIFFDIHHSPDVYYSLLGTHCSLLSLNARRILPEELFLYLFLDDVPSFLCVGHDTGRAVLHAGWQGGIVARAVEEEERAVAEEA